MSVLKSQRKESSIKFLDTAYNLELHTLRCCMKLPKRYTFFIGTELSHLASEVHNHCKTKTAMKGVFLECMQKSAEKFTPLTT